MLVTMITILHIFCLFVSVCTNVRLKGLSVARGVSAAFCLVFVQTNLNCCLDVSKDVPSKMTLLVCTWERASVLNCGD